jgi:intracellular septation protein A
VPDPSQPGPAVARGLVVLGVVALLGLLPWPAARYVAAGAFLVAAVAILVARPVGNRTLAVGLCVAGVLLFFVGGLSSTFVSTSLTILIALVIVLAGGMKLAGKW